MNLSHTKSNEIIVFKPQNGQSEFQIILDGENDTVWVTEQQMAELFMKARRTIGEHIKNIYQEGELDKNSTWREFRQVQKDVNSKPSGSSNFAQSIYPVNQILDILKDLRPLLV